MASIIRRRELLKNGRLPSGFQEVEWIQSSGSQYIDTGYDGGNAYVGRLVATFLSRSGNYNGIFGAENDDERRNYIQLQNKYAIKLQVTSYNVSIKSDYSLNTLYDIEFSTFPVMYLTINGTTYTGSTSEHLPSGRNCYLFWNNSYYASSDSVNPISMTLYSFELYSDANKSTLVRDFVPCYCTTSVTGYKGTSAVTVASGTVGLFDLVNKRFYVNCGSGSDFTKGADVN